MWYPGTVNVQYIEDITWVSGDAKFLYEKRNFVSPSDHVMLYLLYKHQWNAKPFYLNSFLLRNRPKGAVCYEAIAMVIFSHVKITCYFHIWRYQIFARKLTWYFIGVYIIKLYLHLEGFGTAIITTACIHIEKWGINKNLRLGGGSQMLILRFPSTFVLKVVS